MKLKQSGLKKAVKDSLRDFHSALLGKATGITLNQLLSRKNPYLYASLGLGASPEQFLRTLLDAWFSSSMEGCFGNTLESIAHHVITTMKIGIKSGTEGCDYDIVRGRYRFLMSLKSGGQWGNQSSCKEQGNKFERAKKVIRATDKSELVSVMGICYGKKRVTDGLSYADVEIQGQAFWYFLTGDPQLYKLLICLMQEVSSQFYHQFISSREEALVRLLPEFHSRYCLSDGSIDWEILVSSVCENLTVSGGNTRGLSLLKKFMIGIPGNVGDIVLLDEEEVTIRSLTRTFDITVEDSSGNLLTVYPWKLQEK